jgi:ABC-2 type transport system ATP-binding protein
MDEADKLCDTIAIIDNGKIIVTGKPTKLKNSVGGDTVVLVFYQRKPLAMPKLC